MAGIRTRRVLYSTVPPDRAESIADAVTSVEVQTAIELAILLTAGFDECRTTHAVDRCVDPNFPDGRGLCVPWFCRLIAQIKLIFNLEVACSRVGGTSKS